MNTTTQTPPVIRLGNGLAPVENAGRLLTQTQWLVDDFECATSTDADRVAGVARTALMLYRQTMLILHNGEEDQIPPSVSRAISDLRL